MKEKKDRERERKRFGSFLFFLFAPLFILTLTLCFDSLTSVCGLIFPVVVVIVLAVSRKGVVLVAGDLKLLLLPLLLLIRLPVFEKEVPDGLETAGDASHRFTVIDSISTNDKRRTRRRGQQQEQDVDEDED